MSEEGRATRASDAEREQVVDRLGEHAAAGRLEPGELDERVAAALGARTRGELAVVESDMPEPAARPERPARPGPRNELAAYLSVMALLVAIWALTGAGYLWPVWPALGWGIALIGPGGGCAAPGRRHRLSRRAARRA